MSSSMMAILNDHIAAPMMKVVRNHLENGSDFDVCYDQNNGFTVYCVDGVLVLETATKTMKWTDLQNQ
jgi:hypothetical protein